ncbi:MAG: gamma-glutamyltransferase [Alphaproteobacteria bacterium]|nr:gamma-glutamyltransferase [Alphaproteobacteria bacterium]
MRSRIANPALAVALAFGLLTSGCTTIGNFFSDEKPKEGSVGFVSGFLGAVSGDEPQAVLAARKVLSAGGNAVDAAVGGIFALSVTLPSRAGLGGGGACLAHRGDSRAIGYPDAFLFQPQAPASAGGADRPAAAPMLARGLFLMHARQGKARFESLIAVGETLARDGVPASRALVRDLAIVAGPLAGDPAAREIFLPGGQPLAEGAPLLQPDLGSTFAQLRRLGVGELHVGATSQRFLAGAKLAGASLTAEDMRKALPQMTRPLIVPGSEEIAVSFLPTPADGGLAAAIAYQTLAANPTALAEAKSRGLAAAALYRRDGTVAEAMLNGAVAPSGTLPPLPASTTFAVLDREGNAVICALTMGNLFGTGRIAAGTGVMLAASPAWLPPPLLAAGMVTLRRDSALRVMAGGSGQEGAPVAVGLAIARSLADPGRTFTADPAASPEPGRANVVGCNRGPTSPESCGWTTDSRGFGLATGSN